MNDNKCAAVLMGPPGSGKSTVVRALTAHNGMSVIEAGNLLEAEVRLNTPLGQRIKPYKAAGDLVPLECVVQVISAELKNASESLVLFDGFPRCAGQAAPFLQLLKDHRLTLVPCSCSPWMWRRPSNAWVAGGSAPNATPFTMSIRIRRERMAAVTNAAANSSGARMTVRK